MPQVSARARIAVLGLLAGLILGLVWVKATQPSGGSSTFWKPLAFGATVEVEYYTALEDAVRHADFVVTGKVDSIHFGRIWGDIEDVHHQVSSVLLDIEVSEVLRGTLPDPNSSLITVER